MLLCIRLVVLFYFIEALVSIYISAIYSRKIDRENIIEVLIRPNFFIMSTGKRSKRYENTITLDDTDDEDHQQQPGPRIAVNKRRRTILDDDDEVEILPQTSSGNSNRLVIFIYLSHRDTMFRRFVSASKNMFSIIIKPMRTCRNFNLITILTSLLYSSLFYHTI